MDLSQLQALAAAVDEGTFDGAARALRVTPSAISQRIRALENTVGGVLVRRSKPITATSVGEVYLRLARQIDALSAQAALDVSEQIAAAWPAVSLAVNGDSLATWVMPALAELAGEMTFDIHREDQDHSAALLRDGTVMAAITTEARPVQGCTSTALGVMRYRPMASARFIDRWFPTGTDAATLAAAPMVVFDAKDDIQHRYLRMFSDTPLSPPQHFVPVSADFAEAVRLGFGWAMLPDQQSRELEAQGEVVELQAGKPVDVALYWQQWALRMTALDRVAAALAAAAGERLLPLGARDGEISARRLR
ncbi:LysR family transcriptional regulator (chromosome initiation inhibitor) [Okibacterium sp. HSC-33S16]|uniref:LysR family transcriptional regulator ArgP n=1 Tax=Okibacterium sp. HSC-33S16 TaxID=2910965 RepID=UPI00209D092B|nr:LysR family transcriptional regulator ArgP [Okibacterium sp. HSC-33S16]MCP2032650.1 LysR family transcriptional regulator (chromosome initiation inhibitor) [Okibacterium sp. HSC-33S16]